MSDADESMARLAEARIGQVEYFLHRINYTRCPPVRIINCNSIRGFRYEKPGIVEFLVIHIARQISCLSAMKALRASGNYFEFMCLVRMFFECQSRLSYVISGVRRGHIDHVSTEFVASYFADDEVDLAARKPPKQLRQKEIHDRISKSLSEDIDFLRSIGLGEEFDNSDDQMSLLQSTLYRAFSNYLHGWYPESMDLFDHADGMLKARGGVKDWDDAATDELFLELSDSLRKQFAKSCIKLWTVLPTSFDDQIMSFSSGVAGVPWPFATPASPEPEA